MEDVERLDTLISNLLDVARFDRRASDSTEDVPLEEVLQSCAKAACTRHNVDPSIVCLELQPCLVNARRVELEMIFRNLIDNAIKYGGEENAQVIVRSQVTNGPREGLEHVLVEVSDNGRGVPASMRRMIFGRFVRLGQELEREKPGIGLGLYIVRTLIDRLRGKIRVHDRTPGPGTTFEVQLPCRRVVQPQTPATIAPAA
jgi:two-component system, OmpR family, phosphate regulon sensor histidine kinase PhoR